MCVRPQRNRLEPAVCGGDDTLAVVKCLEDDLSELPVGVTASGDFRTMLPLYLYSAESQ